MKLIALDIAASKPIGWARMNESEQIEAYGLFPVNELKNFIFKLSPDHTHIAVERVHLEHNPQTMKLLERVAERIRIHAEDCNMQVIEVASADWQKKIYPLRKPAGIAPHIWKKQKYRFYETVFRQRLTPEHQRLARSQRLKDDIIAAGCIAWHAVRRLKAERTLNV